ncbi:hypothetical protein C8R44DRAFT_885482 [Mycena epipterygia]|nr:hypothetical protein C8R44DRAFT_885482 [Mycena epipterygia]
MPNFNVVQGLVLLFTFLAAAWAQEEVTLWQFGQDRLVVAALTLPLEPLGTESDGSATTYLYQVLNPGATITTVNTAGIITTQTTAQAASRTIVASASGWFEGFGATAAGNISCSFINAKFGACLVGSVTANSGLPTPKTLQVSTSSPSSTITSSPIGTTSTSNSNTPDQQAVKRSHPAGAIIGAVVGGCGLLGISLALFISRQRRLRRIQEKFALSAYFIPSRSDNLVAASQLQTTTTTLPIVGSRKNRAEPGHAGVVPPQGTDPLPSVIFYAYPLFTYTVVFHTSFGVPSADYGLPLVWLLYFLFTSDYILLTDVQRKLPHVPSCPRLKWALDLFTTSPRGVDWAHEPRNAIPSHPDPSTPWATFVFHQLLKIFLGYDIASLYVRSSPTFEPGEHTGVAGLDMRRRFEGVVAWAAVGYAGMVLQHYILGIIYVAVHITERPAFLGGVLNAWSVRSFWGWVLKFASHLYSHNAIFLCHHGRGSHQMLRCVRSSPLSSLELNTATYTYFHPGGLRVI